MSIAVLMIFISTARIGPFRTALFMNLEPLLATIGSAIFLNEVITPLQALGGSVEASHDQVARRTARNVGAVSLFIAGGALLAGHVTIHDRAFISGNCLVHQFVRVGTLAMMQGGSAISQDLPPFTMARGDNTLCGLNIIGLRRAGFAAADRLELKQVYRAIFRSGENFRAALASAKQNFSGAAAKIMLDFLSEAKRGVCSDAASLQAATDKDPTEA